MSNNKIFKAKEVDSSRRGWIADLSGPSVVNPDAYFYFKTKSKAQQFVNRVSSGESASQVYREMSDDPK